jgi:glycosyltransferase involved in cell wall biosynthesis
LELSPGRIAEEAAAEMRRAWGHLADVLHVHNPTLNKNAWLPSILQRLQEMGIRILPQIHDLAEDGRPSAYYKEEQYPADCHYVVINSRDRDALVASGLRPDTVHRVFNTVRPLPPVTARRRATNRPSLLYPVRGIRRKNVGEALLLGALWEADLTVTLPPRNPDDLMRYDDWRRYAIRHELPVRFDQGLHDSLEDLMGQADAAISTSVNEGFGFAFLEPWTAGVPAAGRRVEHVCRDFETAGIRLPHFYEAIFIPLECFDAPSFHERWGHGLRSAFRAFNREPTDPAMEGAWKAMTRDGRVDFGALDEQSQRETLDGMRTDTGIARELLMINPDLDRIRGSLGTTDASLLAHNRSVIEEEFGPRRHAQALLECYHQCMNREVRQRVDKGVLLDQFMRPGRFRMIAFR